MCPLYIECKLHQGSSTSFIQFCLTALHIPACLVNRHLIIHCIGILICNDFFFKEEKKSQFCVATTYVYITYQGPRITGKLLCPISIISICGTEGEVKLKLSAFKTLSPIYSFLYQCPGSVVVNSLDFRAGDWGSNNFQNTFFFFSSFQGHQTFLFKISNLSNHFPIKGSERRVISPINGLSQKLTY